MNKKLNVFKYKYDCVFSLGSACFSSELLTRSQLRIFSSPFDWVAGGSFQERGNLICNDFKDFLGLDNLEKTGEREYPENCYIYLNKKTNIYFHHDFPKEEAINNSYPKVQEKYDRRINRLKEKLVNSKRILIVYMELEKELINANSEIISLTENINNKFGNNNIDLLYIRHDDTMEDNKFNIVQISNNAYVADLYNLRRHDRAQGNHKNCKQILKKIKIRRSFKDLLLKISKTRTKARVYLFGVKIMTVKFAN